MSTAKKQPWEVKLGDPHKRLTILLVCFVGFAVVLAARCVYVQGLDLAGNANKALMPETNLIPAGRGTITDRNGQVLAESVPAVHITADPTIVATNGLVEESMTLRDRLKAQAGPGIIAGVLAMHLDGEFQDYYDKLSTTTTDEGVSIRYTMLARHVLTYNNLPLQRYLDGLGYTGLFREQAPVRNYPNGTLAANVVGYMTYSDELEESGKYPWTGGGGLEQYLNAELSGVDGQEIFESSPYGRIPIGTSIVQEPTEGISYQLTLDLGLQYMQDQRLAAAVIKSGSASGMAITMSVSGEVLAMSSYPTFDPNDLSNATNEVLGNPIVMGPYEPGSVEKVLTLAALVDQGIITPKTHVIVPGSINSGDSTIYDAFRHDTLHLTAAGVLAQSSNIGTILMSRQMSKETFASYLAAFGLGSATGIGLPGEEEGWIPDGTMTDQTRDNIAFGQGLTVTALQEAAALAAIANKGVYVSPRIIKSATTADGRPIEIEAPEVRQVISPEASEMVMSMMEAVVEYNSNSFDIAGFRTGGKSGTAEVVNPKCGCYRGGGYVISYAGIAPIEDPQLITYVVMRYPASGSTGTSSAAPVVRDIMTVALPRYAISPSTTQSPDLPIRW